MTLRGLARLPLSRRLSAAALSADAARALAAGRRRTAVRLLALAALAYRSTALGIAVEVGLRLYRRLRRSGT